MTLRRAIERAAAELRATLPVFTPGNLFHATSRALGKPLSRAAFDEALARAPLDGLLARAPRPGPRMSSFEKAAYYPAGILLVDHDAIVDLFAASGALIQARVAVVSTSGHPRRVLDWLVAGARAGRAAPVGYLHDASTVLYPFAFEPLATLFARDPALPFRDLGFRPGRGFRDPHTRARVSELEAATPAALVAYATRAVLAMIPPDAVLAPRAPR